MLDNILPYQSPEAASRQPDSHPDAVRPRGRVVRRQQLESRAALAEDALAARTLRATQAARAEEGGAGHAHRGIPPSGKRKITRFYDLKLGIFEIFKTSQSDIQSIIDLDLV